MDASDCDECISSDIENYANDALCTVVPEKCKLRYEACYENFKEWQERSKVKTINEKVMLAFFMQKSSTFKPSTMWCVYSKLRTMVYLKDGVDISKFTALIAFLKRKSHGYVATKSKTFTRQEIEKFLIEANDAEYLLMKAVVIVGIAGACRKDELIKVSTNDFTYFDKGVMVAINETKTKVPRQFMITEGSFKNCSLLDILQKYVKLRNPTTPHDRFFVGYRGGKCTVQPVGVNTMSAIPQKIASFLGLENVKAYTGHCFRRTSATLLADSGVDFAVLKRHGGWKSTSVAEGYVDSSVANKCRVAANILGESASMNSVAGPSRVATNILGESATMNSVAGPSRVPMNTTIPASATTTLISSRRIVIEKETLSVGTAPVPFSYNPNFGSSKFENCTFNFHSK